MDINLKSKLNIQNIECGDIIIDRGNRHYMIVQNIIEETYHVLRMDTNNLSCYEYTSIDELVRNYFGNSIMVVVKSKDIQLVRK